MRFECAVLALVFLTSCGAEPTRDEPPPTTDAGPQQPPADVVFHADWSTATGTSPDALRDTSKDAPWSLSIGSGVWEPDETAVIPTGALDFPTENVLRVIIPFDGTEHGPARILRHTGLPVPDVGESLYYRWYKQVTLPDDLPAGFDSLWHPMQDGQASSGSNWEWEVLARHAGDAQPAPGKWRNRIFLKARANHRRFFLDLDLGVTYRFELRVHRVTADEFALETRVYNTAGDLLFDTDDYQSLDPGATLADVTSPFVDVANLDGLNCGQNDVQTGMLGIGADLPFGYQGAFAVRTDDWCGPYAGGI